MLPKIAFSARSGLGVDSSFLTVVGLIGVTDDELSNDFADFVTDY